MRYQSEAIDLIATALAAAQAEMGPAEKNCTNTHTNSRYADLASVRVACGPLAKHGIAITQTIERYEGPAEKAGQEKVEIRRDRENKPVQFRTLVSIQGYLWTQLTHSSGQWIASELPLLADWTQPQQLGITISYYRRYALAALAGVAQEDADGELKSGAGTPRRSEDRPAGNRQQGRPAARLSSPSRPRTGGDLLGWAKADPEVMKFVREWGNGQFPARFLDWPESAVADVYDAWQRHLNDLHGDGAIDEAAAAEPEPSRPEPNPGASGAALFVWATRCSDKGMADAISGGGKARGWPPHITEWNAEQAARGYAYGLARLEKLAEIAAKERAEAESRAQAPQSSQPAPQRGDVAGWFPANLPPAQAAQGAAFNEFTAPGNGAI